MVAIQLLLLGPYRTPEGVAIVRRVSTDLGITSTSSGTTTLSGQMTEAAFEALFGVPAQRIPPSRPDYGDAGSPGGHKSGPISIPIELQPFVESITVAPPFRRMT